jgi:hypothetical protein
MTRHGKAPATSSMGEESSNTGVSDYVVTESTQQSGESRDVDGSFAGQAVEQIEALVESFRTKGIPKSQAIFKIGQIIAGQPGGDEKLKSDSLERYASTLDGIEALSAKSVEHGQRFTNPVLGKRKDDDEGGREGHAEPVGNHAGIANQDDVNDFFEGLSHGGTRIGGGDESGGGSSSDDSSDDDDDDRGRSNKKQRIYESQMPWFNKERRIRRTNTNPSCNKTRNTLDIFQRDHSTVKRWIKCASSAPAGFPNTEWDSLVKGETVDLDTVFSSLHHVHSIDEGVGRVGTTEIQFGRPKPAAKVETSGQWTSAYNFVVKATAFLFPHQYDELREYGDYMEELFSAKSTTVHPKLFKYDEAVRYKVGQGQNILLTDRSEFTRYYEAIVAPDGVGAEGSSDGNQGSPGKGTNPKGKPDICHRFNGASGCPSPADKCKYRHICKKCKKRGHGKVDCKVDEGV